MQNLGEQIFLTYSLKKNILSTCYKLSVDEGRER